MQPGDLILVKSRGRVYELARRFARNPYDHVAVVTAGGRTINIDKPSTRVLPVERLLRESLRPLVLRPRFASEDEQTRFVGELEGLVGAPYDVRRTLQLIERLLERRVLGRARPVPFLGWERRKWICTDAVLLSLERHVTGFSALRSMPLDWTSLGSATTNDLLELARTRPDLLQTVSQAEAATG